MNAALLATLLLSQAQWLGPALDRPATRVVSLAPSTTEMLFALGAGDRVVGVSRFDDYPPEVTKLPRVGGFVDLNVEAVVALRPDLVVTVASRSPPPTLERLAALGIGVLMVPSDRLDQLEALAVTLGRAVGRPEAAQTLVATMRRELEAIRATYAGRPRVRTLLVVGERPIIAAGPGSFIDGALAYISASNALTQGSEFPQIGLEALTLVDADVVVNLTRSDDAALWAQIERARAGRARKVIAVGTDAILRLSPRLPEGLRALGEALHRAP